MSCEIDLLIFVFAKFGLLIDETSPLCLKVRIKMLASVIIAQILLHMRKGKNRQLVSMGCR